MLNKNDPLIAAVQKVMETNQAERNAVAVVNEKFGVTDRRALPRERQHEWDSAYAKVLTEGVEALDEKINMTQSQMANLDGDPKFTGNDLRHLRNKTHVKKAAAGTLEEKKMKDDPCWDTHEMVGMKKGKGGKPVPNCVPVKEQDYSATQPSTMGLKPDYAKPGTTPDYAKPTTQTVNRAEKTSMPAGTVKEENLDEKAPPGREDQVKALKKKFPKGSGSPFAIAWASYKKKKKKKLEEGFNNRHDSSVNASVEEQVVADQLNEDDIDSYENRMTAGMGGFTPYGGGHFGGGGAKTGTLARKPVRVDTPNINTRTGEKLSSGVPKISRASGPRGRMPKKGPWSKSSVPARDVQSGGLRDQALKAAQARNSNPTARPAVDIKSGDLRSQILNRAQQSARARNSNPTASPISRPASDIKAGDIRTNFLNKAQQARTGNNPTSAPVASNGPPNRSLSSVIKKSVMKNPILTGGAAGLAGGVATGGVISTLSDIANRPPAAQANLAKDQSRVSQGLSSAAQQRDAEQDKVGVKRTTVPKNSSVSTVGKDRPGTGIGQGSGAPSGPENIKMATQKAADTFKFTDKERTGKVSAERLKQFYQQKGLKSSGKTTQDLRTFMNAAKNKTLNTKVTPATELQKANQAKLQAGRTTTTSSVAGGQQIAALPSGPAKSTTSTVGPANPTMAANAKDAGQKAVDRMRSQNLAKSQTSSMSAGMSSTAPAPKSTPPKPLSGGAGR